MKLGYEKSANNQTAKMQKSNLRIYVCKRRKEENISSALSLVEHDRRRNKGRGPPDAQGLKTLFEVGLQDRPKTDSSGNGCYGSIQVERLHTPRKDANIVDAPDGLVSDCQSVIAEWKRHASPPQESISRHCLKINTPPALEEAVSSPLTNSPLPSLPFSVCSTNKPSLSLSLPLSVYLFPNRARDSLQPGIVEHDPLSRFCPRWRALFFRALKWPRSHLLRVPSNGNERQRCALCKHEDCSYTFAER